MTPKQIDAERAAWEHRECRAETERLRAALAEASSTLDAACGLLVMVEHLPGIKSALFGVRHSASQVRKALSGSSPAPCAQCERLREALRKYGDHIDGCLSPLFGVDQCKCGYFAALASAPAPDAAPKAEEREMHGDEDENGDDHHASEESKP